MPETTNATPGSPWTALTARHSTAQTELSDCLMDAYLLGIDTATERESKKLDTEEAVGGIGSSRRATDAERRFDVAVERVHALPNSFRRVALAGVNAAYDLGLVRGRASSSRARRRAAMLGPVLQWRDHTAAVLDSLINAAAQQANPTAELVAAATRAREVLCLDPEKTYGWRPAEPGETPGTVEPDDARPQDQHVMSRDYADQLRRLATGLAELGVPLVNGPAGRDPVTTALHAIATAHRATDDWAAFTAAAGLQPPDGAEGPDAAARRFAGELQRLAAGLDDLGIIPAADLPVDEAAVTTALAELELAQRRAGKAFERGPLPEAVYEASVARYDAAMLAAWPDMAEDRDTFLGTVGQAELVQHPAHRAAVEGAVDAALGQAADGLRLLVQLDKDAAAVRAERDDLARRVEVQDQELAASRGNGQPEAVRGDDR